MSHGDQQSKQILVAGIGNIFHGDDAFGVEVVSALRDVDLPDQVHVADMGIRSYDLAFALMDDYRAAILVDATQQGKPPGTLYLIKPDVNNPGGPSGVVANAHSMNPVSALQLVKDLGGTPCPLWLIGCEPAVLQTSNGYIGLSEPVKAAVAGAIEMVKSLVSDILNSGGAVAVEANDEQTVRSR